MQSQCNLLNITICLNFKSHVLAVHCNRACRFAHLIVISRKWFHLISELIFQVTMSMTKKWNKQVKSWLTFCGSRCEEMKRRRKHNEKFRRKSIPFFGAQLEHVIAPIQLCIWPQGDSPFIVVTFWNKLKNTKHVATRLILSQSFDFI